MKVTRTAAGFRVSFPYDKALLHKIQKLQGRRWDAVYRVWWVPLEQEEALQKIYEAEYAKAEISRPIEIGEVPPMPELTIPLSLLKAPYHYQNKGIAYNLEHPGTINGDKMGLGKTIEAIGTAVAWDVWPLLVVCPNTARLMWQKEILAWTGQKSIILQDSVIDTWPKFYDRGMCNIFIVNYESVKKFFVATIREPDKAGERWKVKHIEYKDSARLFKQFIFDESHRIKDIKTQITRFCIGMTVGIKKVQALSGTPVVNNTRDLIPQLFLINRMQDFGGMKFFEERYCKTDEYIAELQYRLRINCFFQRTKAEVAKEMPPKTRQIVYCDITTKTEYKAAVKNLASYLETYKNKTREQIDKSLNAEIMVAIGVCKDISARGKIQAVQEEVTELLAQGEKVILFCHQRVIAAKLLELYPDAVTVTGADTPDQRFANVGKFQTDPKCRVIICSIKAAGVSITLTAASNVIMIELPWHFADAEQCEDRAHRIGQLSPVNIKYMIGQGTIDEEIYALIELKAGLAGSITGNQDDTAKEIIDRIAGSLFRNSKMLV